MSKKKNRPHGHYCKICGEYKANEKFSGKGHAAHICKACSRLSAAEKAAAMDINRMMNFPMRRLPDGEKKWLSLSFKHFKTNFQAMGNGLFCLQFVQFLDALLLFMFQKDLKHSLFEKTNRYISTVPHNFYPQSALRHFYMPVQTQRLELRPFDDNIYAKFLTILPSCLLTVCYRKLTVII